uniref:Uncharacterized protein n=1 Tax=Anguilla anguilla TaxID=7936 RepID=A0A0E9WEV8_ANGAN
MFYLFLLQSRCLHYNAADIQTGQPATSPLNGPNTQFPKWTHSHQETKDLKNKNKKI